MWPLPFMCASMGKMEAHAEKPLKTLDLYLCIGQSIWQGEGNYHRK